MAQQHSMIRPVAVVPVKNIGQAKQRLSPLLDASKRQALYRAMLQDVLAALGQARLLAGVMVVTGDPWASAIATEHGFELLTQTHDEGHTQASTAGARALAERGDQAMLQLPGDLPLLRAEDVDELIMGHGNGRAVTLAPSRDRQGSNGVLCSPPDLLPLRFGDDSFVPHIARALSLGVQPRVLECPGFAFDVDTPDDLLAVINESACRPMGRHAQAYLQHIGMLADGTAPQTTHQA